MTGDIEAALIQIACGEVPDGYSRWTVVMLIQKLIELKIVKDISDETVRLTLKKMNLNLPKHGSWLKRRISDIEKLSQQLSAWEQERNSSKATVQWQFKTTDARIIDT
ncbi:hypothetical protein [Anaerocolumna jejuensis]|uniref:hypothetical protein n=1 Tax=Anaerocolumna jejuensis TaxID=259063 RepID=UPI003F7B81F6